MDDISTIYKSLIRNKIREIENKASAEMDMYLINLKEDLCNISVDIKIKQSSISKQLNHVDTKYTFKDGSSIEIKIPSLVEIY